MISGDDIEAMRDVELLPCPFCGGDAWLSEGFNGVKAECINRGLSCPVNMRTRYQMNKADAATAWNTRANVQHKPQ